MVRIIIAVLIVVSLIAGCSSVRKGYVKRNGKPAGEAISSPSDMKNNENGENISQEMEKPKHRFADTTYIYISKLDKISPKKDSKFEKAVMIYESGDYDRSCEMFEQMKDTYPENDTAYYSVMFYRSECLIIEEDLYGAESILKELLYHANTPDPIMQKVLVRLGQVYCVLGNKDMANTLFKRLRQEYPNSVYIPLANCESVLE